MTDEEQVVITEPVYSEVICLNILIQGFENV